MKRSTITILSLAVCGALLMGPGSGKTEATLVNVSLEPSTKTVGVGDAFSMEVWLRSSAPQGMDGMDMLLQWDTTYVQLDGMTENGPYDWMMAFFTDSNFSDGNAALTLFAQWPPDTPYTDLHAVTLDFTALAVTDSTSLTIPSSLPGHLPTCVAWGGEDITGTLSGADITIVPEPLTMAGLMLGIGSVVTYVRKRRTA